MAKSEASRFTLPLMEKIAAKLILEFEPHCDRMMVAGSVRRQVPYVHDLELLAIPRIYYAEDMFGEDVNRPESMLDAAIEAMITLGRMSVRVGNGPKNKLLIYHWEERDNPEIPIDIFISDHDNWGMSYMVRTGPKDFVRGVMSRLKQMGHAGHAYGVAEYCNVTHMSHNKGCGLKKIPSSITLNRASVADRQEIMCREERAVFELAKMNWLDPEYRK